MINLEIQMPGSNPFQFPLSAGQIVVGRSPGSDLLLDHPSISRQHARLYLNNGRIFVEDLGSSNGTFIQGQRLPPNIQVEWLPGQALAFGQVSLQYHAPAIEKPLATELSGFAQSVETAPPPPMQAQPAIVPEPVSQQASTPIQPPKATPPAPTPVVVQPQLTGQPPSAPARRKGLPVLVWIGIGLLLVICICGPVIWFGRTLLPRIFPGSQAEPTGQTPVANIQPTHEPTIPPEPTAEPASFCSQPVIHILDGVQGQQPASVVFPATATSTLVLEATAVGETPTASPLPAESPTPEALGFQGPLTSLGFLELPFPFDGSNENFGGSDEQFRIASQRNLSGNGGRINSFFDHELPLYPASKDPALPGGKEPAESPVAEHILIFDGTRSPLFAYSGHPGYDYSTFVRQQPTTPVFAPADGVIDAVGTHKASGALFVKLRHSVVGIGEFQTIYFHLNPDEFFNSMLGREGELIAAGTRIGTMGNTGFSTGHHLHFEVRFDINGDGLFNNNEVVDPYGWITSSDFSADPWTRQTGMESRYLWKHPLGVIGAIPADGSGALSGGDAGGRGGGGLFQEPTPIPQTPSAVCAPPGALPASGWLYWSWSPDPKPFEDKIGIGRAYTLSAIDPFGQPVSNFGAPVHVSLPYQVDELDNLQDGTWDVYRLDPATGAWDILPSTFDPRYGRATVETDRPGKFAILGVAVRDLLPPVTTIKLDGPSTDAGIFYDDVAVTLVVEDQSGINQINYSLDGGSTWQVYTDTFTIPAGDQAPLPIVMDEEFFAGGAGTHLVLAAAEDTLGQWEDPPAYRTFSIDPSHAPQYADNTWQFFLQHPAMEQSGIEQSWQGSFRLAEDGTLLGQGTGVMTGVYRCYVEEPFQVIEETTLNGEFNFRLSGKVTGAGSSSTFEIQIQAENERFETHFNNPRCFQFMYDMDRFEGLLTQFPPFRIPAWDGAAILIGYILPSEDWDYLNDVPVEVRITRPSSP